MNACNKGVFLVERLDAARHTDDAHFHGINVYRRGVGKDGNYYRYRIEYVTDTCASGYPLIGVLPENYTRPGRDKRV